MKTIKKRRNKTRKTRRRKTRVKKRRTILKRKRRKNKTQRGGLAIPAYATMFDNKKQQDFCLLEGEFKNSKFKYDRYPMCWKREFFGNVCVEPDSIDPEEKLTLENKGDMKCPKINIKKKEKMREILTYLQNSNSAGSVSRKSVQNRIEDEDERSEYDDFATNLDDSGPNSSKYYSILSRQPQLVSQFPQQHRYQSSQ